MIRLAILSLILLSGCVSKAAYRRDMAQVSKAFNQTMDLLDGMANLHLEAGQRIQKLEARTDHLPVYVGVSTAPYKINRNLRGE